MTIELTQEQKGFVEQLLATGNYADENAVVTRSLKLMQAYEQRRTQLHAELHKAQQDIAAGRCRTITPETAPAFAAEVKQRARALKAKREHTH